MASRWFTWEFFSYYACLFILYVYYTRRTVEISTNAMEQGQLGGLQWSPLLQRPMDLTDHQWRMFRENIVFVTEVMVVFVVLRRIVRLVVNEHRRWMADVLISLVFSALFLVYLHGYSTIFIAIVVSLNFLVAKACKSKSWGGVALGPAFTWVFNIVVLLAGEIYDGFSFGVIDSSLAFMDEKRGIMRWNVVFNLNSLRIISFAMDYYWAASGHASTRDMEKHLQTCDVCQSGETCYQIRQETSQPLGRYSFLTYLSYVFYVPLLIAGPIMSFNAYASQLFRPVSTPLRTMVTYTLRYVFALGLMEVMLSYLYIYSLNEARWLWVDFSPAEISVLGYFTLLLLWLKFLCMWRYFRLVAMLDGIDTIENMTRCVNNNYTLTGFWRNWHRSYNRWLVRYIYIPLGGSRRRLLATLITFTFVAMWHDLKLRLLVWGWGISILFVPEVAANNVAKRLEKRGRVLSRHVRAVGAALNILMMMLANIVGFGVGIEGVGQWIGTLVSLEGVTFLIGALAAFFCAAQIMFEIRAEEARRGLRQQPRSINRQA